MTVVICPHLHFNTLWILLKPWHDMFLLYLYEEKLWRYFSKKSFAISNLEKFSWHIIFFQICQSLQALFPHVSKKSQTVSFRFYIQVFLVSIFLKTYSLLSYFLHAVLSIPLYNQIPIASNLCLGRNCPAFTSCLKNHLFVLIDLMKWLSKVYTK